jgi:hypothetical protein
VAEEGLAEKEAEVLGLGSLLEGLYQGVHELKIKKTYKATILGILAPIA